MQHNETVYTDIELHGKRVLGCIVITHNKLIERSFRFKLNEKTESTGIAEYKVAKIACSYFNNVHIDNDEAFLKLRNEGHDVKLISGRENLADIVLRGKIISKELSWCAACKNHELSYTDNFSNKRCTHCKNVMVDNQYASYFLRPFGKRIKKNSRSTITLQGKVIMPNHFIGEKLINRKLIQGNNGLYKRRWKHTDVDSIYNRVLPKRERYADKLR